MGYSLSVSSSERVREIRAVLRLGCVPGVGTRALWRILNRFGSGRRALEAGPGDGASHSTRRREQPAATHWGPPSSTVECAMAWTVVARPKLRSCCGPDEVYPERLGHLVDPPPVLFARGRIELLSRPAVTIVGSRRSTAYGRRSAEALAAQMALRGITVVSGLALGIDGASHRGALEARGDTIAVLGSGVDLIQPASHRRLGERVAREGLLLSEFLPGEPARAHHFPRRNRILAALGGAVVVVEAAEKSGAMITVEHALDLGRDVYAVPGALDAPQSRGCNLLIRQGAQVITSPEEFGRDLGLVCGSSREFRMAPPVQRARPDPRETSRSAPTAQNEVPIGLDDEARRVWLALSERSLGIDDVASGADLQSAPVVAALTILQVAGLVVQESGMRFRRAS